jgi:hypothetical protein
VGHHALTERYPAVDFTAVTSTMEPSTAAGRRTRGAQPDQCRVEELFEAAERCVAAISAEERHRIAPKVRHGTALG